VFLVTRLPFFWYYPRAALALDSQSYLDVANTMRAGHWPLFIFRTPGYPVLIWMVTSIVDRWLAVILVQNVLSLLSSLAVVYSVHRLRRPLALPAALAMCGFIGSSQVLIYDTSMLSDSLYTSTVILVVASLFMAFATGRAAWFAATSAMMAVSILVRPAGAYFAVIYAMIVLFLLWNRWRPAAAVGFLVPFPALLMGLCTYNKATIGQFVITPFGEANIAGATALFWEPDPRLPAVANKALGGIQQSYRDMGITRADLDLVRNSWDTGPLFDVYSKAYNRLVWSAGWGSGTRFGAGDYLHNRAYIRDVSIIAIRRHPSLYAKYVWVNLVTFFGGIGYTFDVQASLRYEAGQPAAGTPQAAAGPAASDHLMEKLQRGWQAVHGFIFQRILWTWAYFAMLVLSFAQLVRYRGRHLGAFLLLAVTLIPLGAALVVCLVEVALDRYSYATQFICYLSVALCPLLAFASAHEPSGRAQEPPAEPAR